MLWNDCGNDTRAKAERLLSVVALDKFISTAIFGLIGPRANMQGYVRFGSLADICNAKRYVRFTPEKRTLIAG